MSSPGQFAAAAPGRWVAGGGWVELSEEDDTAGNRSRRSFHHPRHYEATPRPQTPPAGSLDLSLAGTGAPERGDKCITSPTLCLVMVLQCVQPHLVFDHGTEVVVPEEH